MEIHRRIRRDMKRYREIWINVYIYICIYICADLISALTPGRPIPKRPMDVRIICFLTKDVELRDATGAKITFLSDLWILTQMINLRRKFELEMRPPPNEFLGQDR